MLETMKEALKPPPDAPLQTDVWFSETRRVAGLEATWYRNNWMQAKVEVQPHDHDRHGYPWTVDIQRTDGQWRKFKGMASTRAVSEAQAKHTMTAYVQLAAEMAAAEKKRRVIYNTLSVRASVPLALDDESTKHAMRQRGIKGSPHLQLVGGTL